MLYLEDYLEMIENLPMEMRDRLTEMREVDLQVQNALDSLDEKVSTFFKKCLQPNIKPEWKDEQYTKIKQDYQQTLEDADEKVQLANHIYDLVDRHLRKLDQEVAKFKMELEADNAGITEILEKRSLELDNPPPSNHKAEKRKFQQTGCSLINNVEKRPAAADKMLSSIASDPGLETITIKRSNSASSSPSLSMFNSGSGTTPSSISYSLGHMGAGSNAAIAAAASQAIAATQQMQQGRRTPSMKASYVAMQRAADLSREITFGKEIAYGSAGSIPTGSAETPNQRTQRKKLSTKASTVAAVPTPTPTPPLIPPPLSAAPLPALPTTVEEFAEPQIVDDNGQPVDWQSDPNEPRYCLCNQVSYGDMVGCDNEDCPIEWFHYGCVGLAQAPKGKWYCPQCVVAMKRRGRR